MWIAPRAPCRSRPTTWRVYQAQFTTASCRCRDPQHGCSRNHRRCAYARQGVEVDGHREVDLQAEDDRDARHTCGARLNHDDGDKVYVSALAEDVGEALGCGAHLSALRRIDTVASIAECVTLKALEAMNNDERQAQLLPARAAGDHRPRRSAPKRSARFLWAAATGPDWPDAAAAVAVSRATTMPSWARPTSRPMSSPGACSTPWNRRNYFDSANNVLVGHQIRDIAIHRHVDHRKTTMVDQLLRPVQHLRRRKWWSTMLMNNTIEKERGIAIIAKNCAVTWKGTHMNMVDTPASADFSGEVGARAVDGRRR